MKWGCNLCDQFYDNWSYKYVPCLNSPSLTNLMSPYYKDKWGADKVLYSFKLTCSKLEIFKLKH